MSKKRRVAEKSDGLGGFMEAKQCLGCIHEGIVATALDGRIVDASPAAEHILDTPPGGLLGRKLQDFVAASDSYTGILAQTAAEARVLNRPLAVSTGAGKRKLVNMSIQRAGDGADGRLIHVFQDCADLRTMEERLLQSERLATIGRFASQIAHEIRNPLNSISLNIELLEDELKAASDEARNLLRSVLRELDRLNDIVGEYLQFARFPKPNLKRGRIQDVVGELAAGFKPPPRIDFSVAMADGVPDVFLDAGLLRQVLDNLVRNALDAIAGDGSIRVETELLDRFVAIHVRDTGSGIPRDARDKLFEPFFTTKAHGTGLGLTTSQQIVFQHNGHLVVESEPGHGATFSILLPI